MEKSTEFVVDQPSTSRNPGVGTGTSIDRIDIVQVQSSESNGCKHEEILEDTN